MQKGLWSKSSRRRLKVAKEVLGGTRSNGFSGFVRSRVRAEE